MMTALIRLLCALALGWSAPLFASFDKGFPKAEAEAAFPAATQGHKRDLVDLHNMRGMPAPDMRTLKVREIAGFLERKDATAPYPPRTSVLFYSVKAGQLTVWLIDRSGLIAAARQPLTPEALDSAIRNLRLSLNVDGIARSRVARPRGQPDERLETRSFLDQDIGLLSTYLLPPPIVKGLKRTEHLLIVANGVIATVPHALLKLDRKTMLIDRMTISVSPGLFDLDQMVRPWNGKAALANALIVGNPKVVASEKWDVPSLPGAEQEALALAALTGGKALIGAEARRDVIVQRLNSASMLYFAAHGVSNPADPLRGGFLMLSGDGPEDGFLRAREVQTRRLSAQLVVLSACQSGLGLIHDGGVIGLSRSFQKARAARVVMSLWSVSDEASFVLMERFQRHLLSATPAVALRQAMLETRKTFPEPALWAPFVMFGTPR